MAREIIFEVVPLLSKDTVSKQEITRSSRPTRRGLQGHGVASQSSFRDLCGMGGVQLGKTKVFFRQVSCSLGV